jgi:hypothetical protein
MRPYRSSHFGTSFLLLCTLAGCSSSREEARGRGTTDGKGAMPPTGAGGTAGQGGSNAMPGGNDMVSRGGGSGAATAGSGVVAGASAGGTGGGSGGSTGGGSGGGTGGNDGGAPGGSGGAAGGGTTSGGTANAGGIAGNGAAGAGPAVLPVDLPDNEPGIGFDDMRYSLELKKLLIPAGRTGDVDLVDPLTLEIVRIGGFTASATFMLGKHRSGSTSADYGDGKIFAIDNETKTVRVVDPATRAITASATLAAAPDYVRWVESTREIWVTMPQNPGVTVPTPEIEVLRVPESGAPVHSLNITFPASGPEALYVDNPRHRAYTNNGRGGDTYAVDLTTHAVAETWKNGCTGLTVDLELDDTRGFLLVACASGRLAVLDVEDGGRQLGELMTGGMGVDVSAYNPTLHHMYLAGQDSADLAIVGVSAAGMPVLLGKVQTAQGSQMVASDEYGNAWVGDPGAGRLIRVRDPYAMTP